MSSNQLSPAGESNTVAKPRGRLWPTIARIFMGVVFCIFGLNGFLNFIPQPKAPMPEGAAAFAGALVKTGYMMPLVTGTQLIVGILLVLNRFVPLALVLIAPILVGIITFHLFLAPSTIAPGLIVLALELYLAWVYRDAFRALFSAKNPL